MVRPSTWRSLGLGAHLGLAGTFVVLGVVVLLSGEAADSAAGAPFGTWALLVLGLPWSMVGLLGEQPLLAGIAATMLNVSLHLWLLTRHRASPSSERPGP